MTVTVNVERASTRATTAAAGPGRLILRQSRRFYAEMCDHLIQHHGFADLAVSEEQTNVFRSKKRLLVEQLSGLWLILRNYRTVRRAQVIYAIGFIALTAKLLRRLGLLEYERLFHYSFFIHSPSWFPVFRLLARLDTDRNTYVISSRGELDLYNTEMGIPRHRMAYLPFGDWQSDQAWQAELSTKATSQTPYYFSGGYSNRDYQALAEAWQNVPNCRLVIVCSRLNTEMDAIDFPSNVEIYRDLPPAEFERWISGAKACILPLKFNSGAAGQTVLLQYMRKKKLVIVNAVDVVDDYIQNEKTGLIVKDIRTDLTNTIKNIEQNKELIEEYSEAAYTYYTHNFSREGLQKQLSSIVESGASETCEGSPTNLRRASAR